MKKAIHPDYNLQTEVTCGGCNATFKTGSTLEKINVGICSECHPFYTGNNTIVDSAGRVDKFKSKYSKFLK